MTLKEKIAFFSRIDPYALLNVSGNADDSQIETSYNYLREKEKNPERLRELEMAYKLIREKRHRVYYNLISPKPLNKIESLKKVLKKKPRYLGPGFWLQAIKELQQHGDRS